MIKQTGFLEKFLKRLNKIDQASLEKYVLSLTKEKDFAYKILHALNEGIIIINPQRIVTFCNSSAKDILMRSTSEIRPSLDDIFEDEVLHEYVQKHFTHSSRVINECINILKPKPMRLRINLIPLYDDEKQDMIAFLVVLYDMDVEHYFELHQRDENVESLAKLAAGIAHEIGNPLNTIHIYLKLISQEIKKTKNKKIAHWVEIISDETQRLDKMVKDFLNVTRGKIAIFKKSNINVCVENALHFLMPEIKKNNIFHTISLDTNIPPFFIDSEKMYEVFLNILKNAIEAMPNGGTLEVKSSHKGNLVTIICHDTGSGIHEDELPHIFDAYYTTKPGGSGLGLMNVYNIIKAHRGRIHIQSQRGEGTMVIVTLPLRREKLQLPHITTSKKYNSEESKEHDL